MSRRARILALLLAVPSAGLARATPAAESAPPPGPKPAVFTNWGDRLDYLHANVPLRLNEQTCRADALFAADGIPPPSRPPRAKLRLGLYAEAADHDGLTGRIQPDFDLDVDLPNLENSWKIFVQSAQNDDLPGVDPTERERGAQIGVRRRLQALRIDLDAGLHSSGLPQAFARAEWKPDLLLGHWKISPRQRVYVESDDGFGEVTSLSCLRWFGPHQGGIFQTVTSAKWTEDSEGVEWEQSTKIGRAVGLIDERRRGNSNAGSRDATNGYGIRYSLFGHKDGSFLIDRHRVTLLYRFPIRRDWIFLDILPEVEWRNEDDWEFGPGIRVGIDALFWGR